MQKLDLADLILQHLHSKNGDYCENVSTLTDELNEQNDTDLTDAEVAAAASYLYDRELIKAAPTWNGPLLHLSLSTIGEDLVNSGYGVKDLARRTVESQVSNTTIQGDVGQFVQGDQNTVIQENATTANDLFDQMLSLLEKHGEVAIAKEARETKQEGGIQSALRYIADKALGSGFTYAGSAATQQVLATIPQIMQALQ
jgi:hypothetical protein